MFKLFLKWSGTSIKYRFKLVDSVCTARVYPPKSLMYAQKQQLWQKLICILFGCNFFFSFFITHREVQDPVQEYRNEVKQKDD